ncbi:MAG: hypothetical protein ABFR95_04230 [Actinomycetota bacterium]
MADVAARLGVSERHSRRLISAVLAELNAASTRAAVAIAIANHWISLTNLATHPAEATRRRYGGERDTASNDTEERQLKKYCVNSNPQPNGDHEVHDITSDRPCHPNPQNRVDLGRHQNCHSAVGKAKQLGYSTANGCKHCALACHTR